MRILQHELDIGYAVGVGNRAIKYYAILQSLKEDIITGAYTPLRVEYTLKEVKPCSLITGKQLFNYRLL